MSTRVVHCKKEPYDFLIDRSTIWGNPFRIGPDGTREQVIDKYRIYVRGRRDLMHMLWLLHGKTLGCWCKPLACHGDVLAELADSEYEAWGGRGPSASYAEWKAE